MVLVVGGILLLGWILNARTALRRPASSALFVATSSNPSSDNNVSPWAPSEWRLDLNIGRESDTIGMPDDWAVRGGRLFFGVECLVESESCPSRSDKDLTWTGGRRPQLVSILEDATYISTAGEQTINISGGAWSLLLPRQKGQAGTLRLWLDLAKAREGSLPAGLAAQKSDVTLQAGERLYLSALCWREADYAIGRRRMEPIEAAARASQERLESQLSHETGDRRLDGNGNPLDTIQASVDMAVLVKDRDDCVRALREAEQIFPSASDSKKSIFGAWPGSTEKLVVGPGTVLVKRKQLFREDFPIVGTWKATPLEVEED